MFTQYRLSREEFRSKLVKLIVGKKDDVKIDVGCEELTEQEKEILRYYYYITYGIDNIHISPMDENILKKVSTPRTIVAST